jgi:UDP-3-O-[3-hydroxymyristoyl] N-acetylglucosamine deacetylase
MIPERTRAETTVAAPIELAGVGLHSGRPARLAIEPAPADHGLVVEVGSHRFPASLASVKEAARCTGLGDGEVRADTMEHVLAALHGLGIANALLRLEGNEAPILDGSALPVVEAIRRGGVTEIEGSSRKVMRLEHPIYAEHGDARGLALPCEALRLSVGVIFPVPVGSQAVDFTDAYNVFAERIAPARTPGFAREWEALKALGLALGATEDNVLPILDEGYGKEERVPLEVATHKALDLMGDLALLGVRIEAHVITARGSHALNHILAAAIRDASRIE